jgi:hypothetical protein
VSIHIEVTLPPPVGLVRNQTDTFEVETAEDYDVAVLKDGVLQVRLAWVTKTYAAHGWLAVECRTDIEDA